jgi:hypothetical protein
MLDDMARVNFPNGLAAVTMRAFIAFCEGKPAQK